MNLKARYGQIFYKFWPYSAIIGRILKNRAIKKCRKKIFPNLKHMLTPHFISEYLLKTFEGLSIVDAWGETSFFYNPDGLAPRGTYFCTIKTQDGANDKASALDRDQIFRLNFGISKGTFSNLFKHVPKRPSKGAVIEGAYDFTQIDSLCPHPVYGWMCWVAILNPSENSFNNLSILMNESYRLVLQKHQKKQKLDIGKKLDI